jgi:hypothetical protein
LERGRDLSNREATSSEGGEIELDADRTADAANERRFGDLWDGFDRVVDLLGETAEREMVVRGAGKSQSENGNIVDGTGFDERGRGSKGKAVEVGLESLVEPNERGLDVSSDPIAHDDDAAAWARRRIEVLDPGNFPKKFFERTGETVFNFGGRRARKRAEHIDHRHVDLRLLLAREHPNGEDAEQHRRQHDDGREL